MPPLVTGEGRYRKSPDLLRSVQTDLFALGCLMYEIMLDQRPYEEIDDEDWEVIAVNYERGGFPSVRGVKYGDVIYRCWTSQYTTAQQSLDIEGVRCDDHDTEHAGSSTVSSLDNQVHFFLPLSALRKSPFGDLDS
ncbi:hypothetical protein BJX66DRAFT_312731 [Aspergillus keveii]|uniref:Protein kinase domain-containing protein n=1 Tax=Aspergillus keveii TaxID=714993 RepID=A0ABR4FT66_9EURO